MKPSSISAERFSKHQPTCAGSGSPASHPERRFRRSRRATRARRADLVGYLNYIHPTGCRSSATAKWPTWTADTRRRCWTAASHASSRWSRPSSSSPTTRNHRRAWRPCATGPRSRCSVPSASAGHVIDVVRAPAQPVSHIGAPHGTACSWTSWASGVLLTGESGLGKSELGLELISRGHGLVADDAVDLFRISPNRHRRPLP